LIGFSLSKDFGARHFKKFQIFFPKCALGHRKPDFLFRFDCQPTGVNSVE
jgi:hypothetical protein